MNGKKRIAIIIPVFLLVFVLHKILSSKIPSEVKDMAFKSVQIFNTAIESHKQDTSMEINQKYLEDIRVINSKIDNLRQEYLDSPEIDDCLNYINLYNNQVLNIFTKVNATILLKDFYSIEDYDQDANENLKTQDSMMKRC